MKIVLVQGKYFNSWESLGLGYIGAYIKAKLKSADVSFFHGCFDSDSLIIESSKDVDLVIFSCTTPTFSYALKLAKEIKKVNTKVRTVVGGYHASALPFSCLVDGIDQVVVGEGEQAIVEIIEGNREKVVYGKRMNFSELFWPDRELIKNERNIQVAYKDNKKRITSFQSHRGPCIFKCKYCADGFMKVLYKDSKNKNVFHRPIPDLLDEIQRVSQEYNLDLIKFADPTWNLNLKWVIEFCQEKIRRSIKIPFYPNIHAGVCSEEMFRLMADANCYEVAIGIESGSPKILDQIGKTTTVEKIKQAVGWAKKANILVRGYFLLGMPEETEEDIKMTESLAEELALDEYGFTILCPYPGTQMYDSVKYENIDWTNTDEYSNNFWRSNCLTNDQLKYWQSYLVNKFRSKLTWHNLTIK